LNTSRICVRTANFASGRPHARNQDVDETFGGPLTIGSQAYVRNPGKRAQQVERIKVQTNVAARDRTFDQFRNCLFHLCRRRRVQIGRPANNRIEKPPGFSEITREIGF
jgi:hypothetical protein